MKRDQQKKKLYNFRQNPVQEWGSDCPPLLGTGDTAPGVLCSVLGPSLQEGHWGTGACPEKGNKAGKGSREQAFWGMAKGAGAVRSGEEEAETLSLSTTTWKEVVARWGSVSSPRWLVIGQEETAWSCARGGLDQILGKISSLKVLSSTGTGCPGRWLSRCTWRYLKGV